MLKDEDERTEEVLQGKFLYAECGGREQNDERPSFLAQLIRLRSTDAAYLSAPTLLIWLAEV